MNNFKTIIGIEVHVALNTNSKMFSPSKNNHNDEVNTNINEIDLALPGTIPSVNEQAVIKAIQLANELNMEIDSCLRFDRKNYFYQDLPKGFQITQQFFPIGKNGKLKILNKTIHIERIHLEEDTAKQLIINNQLCLDYNRSGVPLIEIVSKPDIENSQQAYEYLKQLKRILTFLNISDAKMEDGSLRADVNISIAPHGSEQLGTKVEIKNINSFSNVIKAIDYEVERQTQLILTNNKINQQSRRWDDLTKSTIFMRDKTGAKEYCYFCEPNIININLSKNFIDEAKKSSLISPNTIKNNLIAININENIIDQLLDNYDLYKLFKKVNDKIDDPLLTITWIVIELIALLKKQQKSINDINVQHINYFIEMIDLIKNGEINSKQAKTIFEKIIFESKNPKSLIQELNFKQVTDEKLITDLLQKFISLNQEMILQYDSRPERVEKFFIGQLMKETKGQANPIISIKLLKNLLNKN